MKIGIPAIEEALLRGHLGETVAREHQKEDWTQKRKMMEYGK